MVWPWCALCVAAALLCQAAAQFYSSDQCNWRGSGLSHEAHRRDVEQVYLRCSQGSLEWLYPTGALIVNLRPNTELSPGATQSLHACLKPRADSQGAQLYLERAGELRLLLGEREQTLGRVQCFSLSEGALFVEAVTQTDISRRITAFQYELVPSGGPGAHMYPYLHGGTVPCKPCSDDEVLMAVCTSDFVGRGSVEGPVKSSSPPPPGPGRCSSVAVRLSRLFRQKSGVFVWGGARGRSWSGRVNIPEMCGVLSGNGELLLTGSVRFGEAWLGCAPPYLHFLRLFHAAQEAGTNPCHVDTA